MCFNVKITVSSLRAQAVKNWLLGAGCRHSGLRFGNTPCTHVPLIVSSEPLTVHRGLSTTSEFKHFLLHPPPCAREFFTPCFGPRGSHDSLTEQCLKLRLKQLRACYCQAELQRKYFEAKRVSIVGFFFLPKFYLPPFGCCSIQQEAVEDDYNTPQIWQLILARPEQWRKETQ